MHQIDYSIIVFVQGTPRQIAYFLKALQYQNHTWLNTDVYFITAQPEHVQNTKLIDLPFKPQWILTQSHLLKEQLAKVLTVSLKEYCIITHTQYLPHRDWLKHFVTWRKHQSVPYHVGLGSRDYFPQNKQNYLHQAIIYLKKTRHLSDLAKSYDFSFYDICLPLQALKSLAADLPNLPAHQTLQDWIAFYLLQCGYPFEHTEAFSYLDQENINTHVQSLIQDAKFLPYYCLHHSTFIQIKHAGTQLFHTPATTLNAWLQHQKEQLPSYLQNLEETALYSFNGTEEQSLYQHKYFQRFIKHLLYVQNHYQIKALLHQSAFENMPKYKALSQRIMSAGIESITPSQNTIHRIQQAPKPTKYKLFEIIDFIGALEPAQKNHHIAYIGSKDLGEYLDLSGSYEFINRSTLNHQTNPTHLKTYDWLFLELEINELEMLTQFHFLIEANLKVGGLLFLLSDFPRQSQSFSVLIQKNYSYTLCPDYQGSYVKTLLKHPNLQSSSGYRYLLS